MHKIKILLASSSLAIPGCLHAQTAAPVQGSADSGIADIIVTAQRRDESLSKVPVAVTVLSSVELAQANIVSELDLRTAVPGLAIRAGVNSNQLNYSLRGQSQDPQTNTRPGVLPYINEVQIGGSGGSSAFYDLQSVQVLKGPQGTLFGRAATGGAVLFTTAAPTKELSGYASGLVGDYRSYKVEGAVSGALDGAGNVLGRLAAIHQTQGGFQRNIADNDRFLHGIDRTGVRGSLSLSVGPSFHNDLVVDFYHARGTNTAVELGGLSPISSAFIPLENLYAGTATPAARAIGIATVQGFLAGAPPAVIAAVPAYYDALFQGRSGLRGQLNEQNARGPYQVNTNDLNFVRADNIIVTNRSALDLGGNLKLRNIFGYTRLHQQNGFDGDDTTFVISHAIFRDKTRQFSEELQLQGSTFDNKLAFTVGGYYSDERNTQDQSTQAFDILLAPTSQTNRYLLTARTLAGYGEGTYHITGPIAVIAGLRYTSEKTGRVTLAGDASRTLLGDTAPAGYDYDQSKTFNSVSWRFGLQDQVNSNLLLYAQTRRAFKPGGFNGRVAPLVGNADQGGDGYKTERVTDVEVGAKFAGLLAEMPLRLTVDYYHNWIINSQRAAFTLVQGGLASLTANVPKGTVQGVEMEGSVKPAKWLTIGGSANYIDAKYSDDPVIIGFSTTPTAPITLLSRVYNQFVDTPKFSGSISSDIQVPLTGDLNGLLHADYYYQTKTNITPRAAATDDGTTLRGYGLLDLRAGISSSSQNWSIIANVKNVTGKRYDVGGVAAGDIYQLNTVIPGSPRMFTIEARVTF